MEIIYRDAARHKSGQLQEQFAIYTTCENWRYGMKMTQTMPQTLDGSYAHQVKLQANLRIFFIFLVISCLSLTACNNGGQSNHIKLNTHPGTIVLQPGTTGAIRVDVIDLPAGESFTGYSINFDEIATGIDISTSNCPQDGVGTDFCEIWTLTADTNAELASYGVDIEAVGATVPILEAYVNITVSYLHTVGGQVSGLNGTLVLGDRFDDSVTINGDGSFTVGPPLADGRGYSVKILTQPENQRCTVTNGSGLISGSDITDVMVTCEDIGSYTVGGSVRSLAVGQVVILQNNGGDDLSITGNGSIINFNFPTPLPDFSNYSVVISNQPDNQICYFSNSSIDSSYNNNVIRGHDVTSIEISCTDKPPGSYTVGGNVTGLANGAFVYLDDGTFTSIFRVNGPFTVRFPFDDGADYDFTIITQPENQVCVIANSSGTINGADIIDVSVSCQNDSDSDGSADLIDNCPLNSNRNQADADADGFGDRCDDCQDDPDKIDPGSCGCGVADIDNDDDGILDCMANCADVSGVWRLDVTNVTSSCGPELDWESTITIMQFGCMLEITGFKNSFLPVAGSVADTLVSIGPDTFPEDGGLTTSKFAMILSSGTSMGGVGDEENWSWVDSGSSCVGGTSDATATKIP